MSSLALLGGALLAAASADPQALVARGEAALGEGRYEDARVAYVGALEGGPRYEVLVGLGVALGRLGRLEEATVPLARALALDQRRAEAWVERGGVRFLQGRYLDAVRDLSAALERADDTYTRELLATALHLTGRSDEALREWNRLGDPQLRSLEISGLEHTRASLVRQAIALEEGALLDARAVRRARLMLAELGVFDRVTVRPVPLPGAQADLDVALLDRRGLARSLPELGAVTAVNLVSERVQLRYVNLLGRGLAVGGRWRWEENRPEIALALEWPRPFGWTGKLRLRSSRGRQGFALSQTPDFPLRSTLDRSLRTLGVSYRQIVGDGTAIEYGPRLDWRSFAGQHPAAASGGVLGWDAAVEQRVLESYRSRMEGKVSFWSAAIGTANRFAKGSATLSYKGSLGPAGEEGLERSVLALRVGLGGATGRAPSMNGSRPAPIPTWSFRCEGIGRPVTGCSGSRR